MKSELIKKEGLTIALIAPSRGTNKKKLSIAKKRLRNLGIRRIVHRKNILKKKLGYWGGESSERTSELNKLFKNEDIDIIWALNGGMSSIELTEELDYKKIENNKKILIGFSDLTSIQLALNKHSKIESVQYYMPGIKQWLKTKKEKEMMENIILLKENRVKIRDKQIYYPGKFSGELIGGCLSLICSSMGTPNEIETEGKILYIEETNATPQRIYNDLYQLYLGKKFDNIKGLIFSKMTYCGKYLEFLKLFLKKIENKKIPILIELEGGHYKKKIPFILGGRCSIDTELRTIKTDFSENFKKELLKNKKKIRV